MSDAELDAAYTHLCNTLTRLGQEQAQAFLARLAVLATARSSSCEAALALIDDAAAEMPAP